MRDAETTECDNPTDSREEKLVDHGRPASSASTGIDDVEERLVAEGK